METISSYADLFCHCLVVGLLERQRLSEVMHVLPILSSQ